MPSTRVAVRNLSALPSALVQEEVWHALVCNAEFLLNDIQNEAVAEQLREKRRFYGEQVPLPAACLI